jgi:hypothetical protein
MAPAVFSIGLGAGCFLEFIILGRHPHMVNTNNKPALIYLDFQRAFNGNLPG